MKMRLLTITGLPLLLTLLLLLSCQPSDGDVKNSDLAETDDSGIELIRIEMITRRHCSGCHLFPEPALLDKNTWANQTLPAMGPHLGIFEYKGEEYPRDLTADLPENFYPERALLSENEWQDILDFYAEMSPNRLESSVEYDEIIRDELFFETMRPSYRSDSNPMVSAITFDRGNRLIYMADANLERIVIFNSDLEVVNSFKVPASVAEITIINDDSEPGRKEMLITYIANIGPSDALDGSISHGWYDPATGGGEFDIKIIENIARPVKAKLSDLDNSGVPDLLVNEFGHRKGSLFWLKGDGEGGFQPEKNFLINTPGCLDSEVVDWTGNGLPDILVLCSQVDQAIYLFKNLGNGEFSRSTLLQFPITAGSSSFEVHDFNGNGLWDILYTSGDNADYSMVYKPYHGVYIYTNEGDDQFTESWFYPINGAYSAKARDFSGDGSLDIAVTSFFADYARKPQEGFIFFKNIGNLTFTPYHPAEASYGRWIAMDTADWTGNGRDDIVLANFSLGPTKVHQQVEAVLTQSPHLLVLKNLSAPDN